MAAAAISAADAACVARVPALLEALRGGEDAVESALLELIDPVLAGTSRAPVYPSALSALLSAGLVPFLLSLCTRANPGSSPFGALVQACYVSNAARDQVGLNGFRQMCDIMERDAALAPVVFPVLRKTATSESVKAAVVGEEGLQTLRRLMLLGDRFPTESTFGTVINLFVHAPAATSQAFFECGVVMWLEKLLRRFVRNAPVLAVARRLVRICRPLLQTPDHRERMRPLYHYFSSALALFSRLPTSEDLTQTALHAAHCLRLAADTGTQRSAIALSFVFGQPGVLASMARLADVRPPLLSDHDAQQIAGSLMRTFLAPQCFPEWSFPSLLDVFYTLPALCLIPFQPADAVRLMAICTTPVALHHLAQPQLEHQRVCAAASLAILATKSDRFVGHLADNAHLEALIDAAFEAATAPDDAAAAKPGGCSREWHTTALLIAVAHAARVCRIAAPAVMEEGEEETRRKRPRISVLDASDVGVQHHSSTTFLIASRPFYVHSIALEKVSPVLKQAMEAAGGSREPIALPLLIDAPVDRHYALFGLTVEFAYTGAISRLSDDDSLPLYTLAEFLQIDALCSYVLDTRLRHLMRADLALSERVWAAAMTFPALHEAAATSIVAHLSRPDTPEGDVRLLLRRCHDVSAAQPSTAPVEDDEPRVRWVVSLFARTMRSALRVRTAAAGAGAAGAA